MYFGLSFSRVGADFRGLLAPIFYKVILNNFKTSMFKANQNFELDIETYTLINKIASATSAVQTVAKADDISPPEVLLDFYPLAIYCNNILTALNELRHCAPIALVNDVTCLLQSSLEHVSTNILNFYRQEQQAFGAHERENFGKLCACFAYHLVPYIQKCIHVLYPPAVVTTHLGINAMTLQKEGFTYLKKKEILQCLDRLIPLKSEMNILQQPQAAVTVAE